ncbi:hypothetical protein ACFSX9_07585 [Flavobacterium ardleyense]|uniref:Lipoprotein n=1 Tax=Flavobacterium ardleyense TaxID=2038737 RepID=A0ABW5Z8G1_9FLAO
MKTNKLFLALVMLLVLVSCKKEDSAEKENQTDVKTNNTFIITLNAIVKKDDSFQVYYKDVVDEQVAFDESNSIYVDVKGSDSAQDIVFVLPEDAYPAQIRLDYGINKDQSEIKINSFKVNYLNNVVDLNANEFFKHFIFNESTLVKDTINNTIKPLVFNKEGYDPMSYSEKLLNDKFQKLLE